MKRVNGERYIMRSPTFSSHLIQLNSNSDGHDIENCEMFTEVWFGDLGKRSFGRIILVKHVVINKFGGKLRESDNCE